MSTNTIATAPAVEGCLESCRRALELLDHFERAGGAYAAIGPHLRHCLDHVQCFLRGLESGTVEYDARERDARLETDVACFRNAMTRAMDVLAGLDHDAMPRALQVVQVPAPAHEPMPVASTVERELLFLSGHTIHHLAIVAYIARAQGITVPEYLFIAYSTAAYHASLQND